MWGLIPKGYATYRVTEHFFSILDPWFFSLLYLSRQIYEVLGSFSESLFTDFLPVWWRLAEVYAETGLTAEIGLECYK